MFALALPSVAKAVEIQWSLNPELIYEYKVWRLDSSGGYTLLGSSKQPKFNLGNLSAVTSIFVSAVAPSGLESPKSEVMVINPAEAAPFIYLSVEAERKYIFAVNGNADKRFFRFNVDNGKATMQDSFNLAQWRSWTTVDVGAGGVKTKLYK